MASAAPLRLEVQFVADSDLGRGDRSGSDANALPEDDTPPARMPSPSILFDASDAPPAIAEPAPDYFADLLLDRIVASVTAGRADHGVGPHFRAPLKSVGAVAYRQKVFRDLENRALLDRVRSFSASMRSVRGHLDHAARTDYPRDRARWLLVGAEIYCRAVADLADGLTLVKPRSRGFRALRDHLVAYTASGPFAELLGDTQRVEADLRAIAYDVHISGRRIGVDRSSSEPDYGDEVRRAFSRFSRGAVRHQRFPSTGSSDMNHVEAAILDLVARLRPGAFASLARYQERHRDFLDETVRRFDDEVQFYLAYLEFMDRYTSVGLPFCYPEVADGATGIHGRGVFDLALAASLASENRSVVTNEFHLSGPERILVVSGPNQGGKTTFARSIGQLFHLASIGCPVPGTSATVPLVDRILVHFEREEDLGALSGKLEDDLRRMHRILELATPDSLVVMNESFGSTTLSDALLLNREILQQIIERRVVCVAVTFLDELSSLSEATVSMVSAVDPDDPSVRTFRIVRKPADGLAYAWAIAEKHGLTFDRVVERVAR